MHVVAVDVISGEELLLSRGPVVEAILASAAIPAVLPPVEWEGRMLIDGGVANNTPISQAVALGASRIYVLPSGHACSLEKPPTSALGMALHAVGLLDAAAPHQRHRAPPRRRPPDRPAPRRAR